MINVLILGANGQLARNTTRVFQPFKGHDVSLNSVSDLIVKLAVNPGMEIRRSLGVSRG